jgi:CRISPR-associated protein Csm3
MRIEKIDFILALESGLHIGANEDSMKIGGVDSPVLKREVFVNDKGEVSADDKAKKLKEPYIPGSSIKGKMRSLLEQYFDVTDGEPANLDSPKGRGTSENRELVIKLFGQIGNATKSVGITRGLFRDGYLTNKYRKLAFEKRIELFEAKYENVIDRKTGTTKNGGLRQIERVPSGIEFNVSLSVRYFETEQEKGKLLSLLILGLKLLELDALGGSGSRGYGKVKFNGLEKINVNVNKSTVLTDIESQLSSLNLA